MSVTPTNRLAWPALLILPATLIMAILVGSTLATTAQQADQIAALSTNSDALREQIKASGETPIAPPAESTVAAVDGKNGSQGLTGLTGDKGDKGDKGDTGLTGLTGLAGVAGTDGLSTVGEPGADGVSITGDTGATGDTGSTGGPGADGAAGTAGAPPYGWTTTHADGRTETCNRADPFDPAAPTYTCAFAPTATPAP